MRGHARIDCRYPESSSAVDPCDTGTGPRTEVPLTTWYAFDIERQQLRVVRIWADIIADTLVLECLLAFVFFAGVSDTVACFSSSFSSSVSWPSFLCLCVLSLRHRVPRSHAQYDDHQLLQVKTCELPDGGCPWILHDNS